MNETNWIPALVVLALGILTAVIFLLTSRSSKEKSSGKEAKAEELDAKARQLIEALKELEQNKHQLSAEQLEKERSRLEKEAAAALRARDAALGRKVGAPIAAAGSVSAPSPAAAPAAQGGFFGQHPELKGAIWGAAVVLFFGGIVLWVYENQKPKDEVQPIAQPQMDPQEAQLAAVIQRLNANPQDTELAAMVGHELIRLRRWEDASEVTERSLGVDPFQVENRIHRALLRAPRGDIQGAMQELTQIANAYPKAYEALLFLGSLAMQEGDPKTALSAFERYAAEAPADEQPPQLAEAIRQLRAHP